MSGGGSTGSDVRAVNSYGRPSVLTPLGGRYKTPLSNPKPPSPRTPAELRDSYEDAIPYAPNMIGSGWPESVFEFPRKARPPLAEEFKIAARRSLNAAATEQLVVSHQLDLREAGRLLWIAGSELIQAADGSVVFGGFDITWILKISKGDGKARRRSTLSTWQTPIGETNRPTPITIDLSGRSLVELYAIVPAGAARVITGLLQGWSAPYTGGGPFSR